MFQGDIEDFVEIRTDFAGTTDEVTICAEFLPDISTGLDLHSRRTSILTRFSS